MRFSWFRVLLPLSVLPVIACSAESDTSAPSEPSGASGEEAINGGKVERAYPAVGMLRFASGSFGSGALISPTVVLTAAHVALGKPTTFYFGNVDAKKPPTAPNLRQAPVKEWVVHPCYDKPEGPGCPGKLDVAVVHLAAPITDVQPLVRYAGDVRLFWGLYNPLVGDVCQAVGFGAHLEGDAGLYTVGTRRSAKSQVTDVDGTEVVVKWVTGIATSGDSGGPLLCDGKIVGTVRGSADPSNVSVERNREAYVRIDRSRDFVDDYLAAWR